jgi:hypothetical protein
VQIAAQIACEQGRHAPGDLHAVIGFENEFDAAVVGLAHLGAAQGAHRRSGGLGSGLAHLPPILRADRTKKEPANG